MCGDIRHLEPNARYCRDEVRHPPEQESELGSLRAARGPFGVGHAARVKVERPDEWP
jgi:hypothetical protein